MKKKILIVGAGGHGRVVAEAVLASGRYELAGFADDTRAKGEEVMPGYRVLASTAEEKLLRSLADGFVVAIGNNAIRKQLFEKLSRIFEPLTVIHPAAVVSVTATTGAGCMILAGAVVGPSAVIGVNSILNVQSLVDHDSIIGPSSHIAQGALVGSGCQAPEGYLLGLGERLPSYQKIS